MERKIKALFLDRDGVVNIDKTHMYKIEDCELVDGIMELCHYLQSRQYLIFIVTNQAGIAKGYYTLEQMQALHGYIFNCFEQQGIHIQHFYYCPHHPNFTGLCSCRKPQPGLIFQARDDYGVSLSESVLVGDKLSDIGAGVSAGVGRNLLLKTRYDYSGYTGRLYNSLPEILAELKKENE